MKVRSRIAIAAVALSLAMPLAAQQAPAGEKSVTVTAIPGVIAAGAKWQRILSVPMNVDGMTTAPDGAVWFAQEQSNAIWKLWPDGKVWVAWPYVQGGGAVSADAAGRVFALERTCTDPGWKGTSTCTEATRVTQLAPTRKVLADKFSDGKPLGRLNDVQADGHGGVWYTQGGIYHVAADGTVSTVAEGNGMFTNGVALSPDGKTLYVTNKKVIVAFDVGADGSTSNQRDFATLANEDKGFGGDGMAVDSTGRLYVTGDAGIHVLDPSGKELGVIPAPRRTITLTFAGPGKRTLFAGAMGAVDPDGKEWTTPQGVRNDAMTVYKVPMLAMGPKDRPK
jgi:gluconolactonase